MSVINHLSPSSYATFKQCPKRFYFNKIGQLPDKLPGDEAHIGTVTHAVLEDFMTLERPLRTKSEIDNIAVKKLDEFKESEHYMFINVSDEEFKSAVKAALDGYIEIEDPTQVEVHSVEFELSVEFDGAFLYGFIDSVVYDEVNGGLIVRDFKTGKVPGDKYVADKMIQPMMYAAGLRKLGYKVRRVELMYVTHGVVIGNDVTDEELDSVVELFKKTWDEINSPDQQWKEKPGPLCYWCPYREHCPKGDKAALNYVKFRAWKGNPIE